MCLVTEQPLWEVWDNQLRRSYLKNPIHNDDITNIFNIILQPWEVTDAPSGTKKKKKSPLKAVHYKGNEGNDE